MDQPPVVAMHEVGAMLGLTRRRVATLVAREDFPAPLAILTVGRIWTSDGVRKWAEQTGRATHLIPAAAPRQPRRRADRSGGARGSGTGPVTD